MSANDPKQTWAGRDISATGREFHQAEPGAANFGQNSNKFLGVGCGALGFQAFSVSGRVMGSIMKNGVATHGLHRAYYVLQLDGRAKSGHRRLVDALRAGLQLKDRFPRCEIKVRATQTSTQSAELRQRTVLH